MPTISIAEPIEINAIVWISSLPEADQGPSRRMLEDLTDFSHQDGFPVLDHVVGDRSSLFKVLDQLAIDAAAGLRPILHIDAHGAADDGLALAPSGEFASWPELVDRLRAINVATGNNLVVVFALCYGLHLYTYVELAKPTPAYLFAAGSQVVTVGFLEDEVLKFYKAVQANGGFLEAFAATLSKEMALINCQGLFLQALAHYVRTQCAGEALEQRVARTVPTVLQRAGIIDPTPEQISDAQAQVRAKLQPGPHIIKHYQSRFLIGREAKFTYQQVKALAAPGVAITQ